MRTPRSDFDSLSQLQRERKLKWSEEAAAPCKGRTACIASLGGATSTSAMMFRLSRFTKLQEAVGQTRNRILEYGVRVGLESLRT